MMFQTDRGRANAAYDEAAAGLAEVLASGRDTVVLCEGDPLLFGSFAYLHQRLAKRFSCTVIPGITSLSGAAAVAATVVATGNDCLTIVPATAGEERLRRALREYDSVVVMKPGRHRPRILQALRETGRLEDTLYIEQATRRGERVIRRVADMAPTPGPYFALFLVTRGSGS
jgi:precorrin-2/cobalt-factor-2 C20-methyltransferase